MDDLQRAALALYRAGRWELPGMAEWEQAHLWEALRDALKLPPGTTTESP